MHVELITLYKKNLIYITKKHDITFDAWKEKA